MIHYRAVIFDCDSTLSAFEGIEALADRHREQVEELTAAAMKGDVPLEEVYGRRLDLIRPSRESVDALVARYRAALVPDAAAVVSTLLGAGVDVRVVSGGLRPAVSGLARHLGIPDASVAAVPVRFDDRGDYAGFDADAPPARAGGKAEVVREWRAGGMAGPVMLVGDGATDLEARGDVDLFVAYAGVIARPSVLAEAPVVVRSRSLAPVLPLALGDVRPDHAGSAALYDRGKALIKDGMVEWR